MDQRTHPIQNGTSDFQSTLIHNCMNNNFQQHLPQKTKYFTAAVIFYGNIAYGCALNTYGPVITTMQHKYKTDDATISKAFSILIGCFMIGALAAGFVYNHVNRQLAVVSMLMTIAIIVFLTPHCPNLTTFFASIAIMGICAGLYDTAQFVWIMEMMQKDCPPFVQSQFFFYAFGANLVSLIMAPFLKGESFIGGEQLSVNRDLISSTEDETVEEDASKLFVPYSIVEMLVFIGALAQLLLFTFMRYYPPPPEVPPEDHQQMDGKLEMSETEDKSGFRIGSWSLLKLRLVILCLCFYGAYCAMEMSIIQFFPKFGQNCDLKLSESQSSLVLSGMTGSFAVSRGIAIFAVMKFSARLILCGNLALLVIANGVLFMWRQTSLPMLWTTGILFGMGLSSVYASFSAWMERSLRFTNFIGSLMLVGGSGVAVIYPMIIGSFIEKKPVVLSYTTGVSIAVLVVTFSVLSYLTHKNKTRY